jgi:rhodanese-related sulfurtransferase
LIAQLSPRELVAWRSDGGRAPPVVVDVRERWEFDYCRIEDSTSVPLGMLPQAIDELPPDRDIVLVCHHGVRSQHAAEWLQRAGFDRVHNLRGGVAAWADEVDPAMPRY